MAGRIVRPHGVQGELVVEPESDVMGQVGPGTALMLGEDRRVVRLTALRRHQDRYLIRLEGVRTRPQAEALRGKALRLRLDQVDLPEGVYFRWQLIGLRVETDEGKPLGELTDILGTGANDVYQVRLDDGREVLIPAIDSVVIGIDLPRRRVRVRLLPGLIDPA